MKSSLYSAPVIEPLQNYHPIKESVCSMKNSNMNALHAYKVIANQDNV